MKMSDKELDALRVASSMPSCQTYGRNTVLELLGHIDAQEKEIEAIKAAADRLQDNIVQLRKELKITRDEMTEAVMREAQLRFQLEELEARTKPVVLPREVASVFDLWNFDDKEALGWAMFNILTCREQELNPSARIIKAHLGESPFKLASAIVNGYTTDEQTPDEYVFAEFEKLCGTAQNSAADAVIMVIEKLAPGKTELLEKMRAVDRLPF